MKNTWIKKEIGDPELDQLYDYYEYHEDNEKNSVWYERRKKGEIPPSHKPKGNWEV